MQIEKQIFIVLDMKRLFILFIVLAVSCGPLFSQKKDTYRVRTVVIDPGHGGAKPGAQGSRSWEKNITLAVAKKFGKLVEDNYPNVKVIYTRTTDVDISLAERARIANRNKADLFISIHANSHPTTSPTGVETFVMGLSESKANLEVAKKENADILLEADYKSDADYKDFDPNSPESWVVLAFYQNSYLDKSLNLAQAIQNQYKNSLKTINRGVKQAELFVLYKTTCPSVLTEIGFISNPTEEAFMLSDEGQAKIAICLFNAFMHYKATEEGTNKPANPVFNIPGYKIEGAEKEIDATPLPKPEPVVVKAEEPMAETKAERVKAEQQAQPVKDEPYVTVKQEPIVSESKPESIKPEPKHEQAVTPQEKPTPTIELPKQEPKPEPVKEEPQAESIQELQKNTPLHKDPKPTLQRETLTAPVNTVDTDASQYYTVQFLTATKRYAVGAPELGGVSDFQIIQKGRLLAYITGRFATFKEASAYCEYLHGVTKFKDAWTFLFKAPVRQAEEPAVQQATPTKPTPETTQRQAQTTSKTKPTASANVVSYRIQFLSASKVMKAGDPSLHGIKDFRYAHAGKLYIYTTGDYNNIDAAQRRCSEIQRSTPFKDAFVFAVYKGERITLEQAAAMEKH